MQIISQYLGVVFLWFYNITDNWGKSIFLIGILLGLIYSVTLIIMEFIKNIKVRSVIWLICFVFLIILICITFDELPLLVNGENLSFGSYVDVTVRQFSFQFSFIWLAITLIAAIPDFCYEGRKDFGKFLLFQLAIVFAIGILCIPMITLFFIGLGLADKIYCILSKIAYIMDKRFSIKDDDDKTINYYIFKIISENSCTIDDVTKKINKYYKDANLLINKEKVKNIIYMHLIEETLTYDEKENLKFTFKGSLMFNKTNIKPLYNEWKKS